MDSQLIAGSPWMKMMGKYKEMCWLGLCSQWVRSKQVIVSEIFTQFIIVNRENVKLYCSLILFTVLGSCDFLKHLTSVPLNAQQQ